MLMSKNVNNDVRKDSPIDSLLLSTEESVPKHQTHQSAEKLDLTEFVGKGFSTRKSRV